MSDIDKLVKLSEDIEQAKDCLIQMVFCFFEKAGV